MLLKLARWLGWSVSLSLIPYVGLYLLRFLTAGGDWGQLDAVLGTGQLFLTSVALLAGGIRELSPIVRPERSRAREFVLICAFAFFLLQAICYGGLAELLIHDETMSDEMRHIDTEASLICLAFTVLIGGAAVAVSYMGEGLPS